MQFSDFILGDRQLHLRFYLATAILGKFITREKSQYSSEYLAREIGCSTVMANDMCSVLQRAGFLRDAQDGWLLGCESSCITLGDVFAAVTDLSYRCGSGLAPDIGNPESVRQADLLVAQAAIGVNENVYRYLCRFSLLSLKVRAGKAQGLCSVSSVFV